MRCIHRTVVEFTFYAQDDNLDLILAYAVETSEEKTWFWDIIDDEKRRNGRGNLETCRLFPEELNSGDLVSADYCVQVTRRQQRVWIDR